VVTLGCGKCAEVGFVATVVPAVFCVLPECNVQVLQSGKTMTTQLCLHSEQGNVVAKGSTQGVLFTYAGSVVLSTN
jgi:hypothetical protein